MSLSPKHDFDVQTSSCEQWSSQAVTKQQNEEKQLEFLTDKQMHGTEFALLPVQPHCV